MILCFVSQTRCKRVVRNGSPTRRAAQLRIGRRAMPLLWAEECPSLDFGVDGTVAGPTVPERVSGPRQSPSKQQQQQQAGNGKRKSQKQKQGFAKLVVNRPVNMAAAAKVARRVPLIKFPNRKGGNTQGAVAVNRASGGGGGGQSPPTPSLPSGTASSQPPRTKLTEAEIDAILLGGAAP